MTRQPGTRAIRRHRTDGETRRTAGAAGLLAAAALALGGLGWNAVLAAAAVNAPATDALQAAGAASLSVPGILSGVATSSSASAWAVGETPLGTPNRPVLAHWNGHAWKQVSSPALPSRGGLAAVTSAPGGALAVGSAGRVQEGGGTSRPLILRHTGSGWKRMALPSTGRGALTGVTATSARNAWAVGFTTGGPPLILHWNGTAWRKVAFPDIGPGSFLSDVTATSPGNAWAVGQRLGKPLILHWGGRRWRTVRLPQPTASLDSLSGVTATSAGNAWAVGITRQGALILHWNGTAWKRVPTPALSRGSVLRSVDASSASTAWAVGQSGTGTGLTLHWNGRSWRRVPSNAPAASALNGVSIGPSGEAWAVGYAMQKTLFLHWNGRAWH